MKRLTLVLSMLIALIGLNANAAIYLVGSEPFGQGWEPSKGVEMTDNGDGTYSFTATVDGTVYFCFADALAEVAGDWNTFNGSYRFGPTGGTDQTVTAGEWTTTQRQGNGNGSYKFTGSGDDYTVTFNLTEMKFKVEGYVEPISEDVYTVAGSNVDLFGTSWDPTNADNDMTLVAGLYTWEKTNVTLPAGAFEFKVTANHSWDIAYPASNYYQAVAVKGIYDVKITFNADTKDVNCELTLVEELPDTEEHTYTVAGNNVALFGTEWDETNDDNNMTLVEGLYTFTKDNVELTAGTIEFKVVQDHNWDIAYPSENWVATIAENGNYNVKITFNEATKDINFEATAVEVIDDFYNVAGAPAAIFGEEWNPGYAANNMTLADGVYTWAKNDVELTNGTKIEFKVVKNGNWANAWPVNNYEYTCGEDGTYNLVITFNPETQEVTFAANKQGEEPPVEMVYTVAGPAAVFGSDWDATDTNNDMVLNAETGLYTWTAFGVALTTDGFGFKVVGNHDWANEWPQGYDNNWIVNIAEDGVYDIVITFNAENGEINCTTTKQEVAPAVRGDVNEDGAVDIADVTTLIDYLLRGNDAPATADCNLDDEIDIADVTALIDYLLKGEWPAEEMVYTVVGFENVFGSNWDPADENNNMVKGADGVYTWTKEGVTLYGNFEFKVVGNHDYSIYEWPIGMNNWVANVAEEGVYTILITFNPEADDADRITCTLTKTGDVAPVEHVYTVAGTENLFGSNWDPTDADNDMVKGDDGIYTWTKEDVEFTDYATIEFKVVQDHAWTYAWPSSNWWAEITEAGIYNFVVTFNPSADDMNKITFTATKQVEE